MAKSTRDIPITITPIMTITSREENTRLTLNREKRFIFLDFYIFIVNFLFSSRNIYDLVEYLRVNKVQLRIVNSKQKKFDNCAELKKCNSNKPLLTLAKKAKYLYGITLCSEVAFRS